MILPGLLPLLILQGAQAPPPDAPPISAQASVVRVRSRQGSARTNQGSGVVVAPGLVATNAHVIEDLQEIVVSQGPRAWFATEARMDWDHDLCLLTVPGMTVPAAVPAPEPAGPGQEVVAVGYPGGQGPVASRGRLRGIWHHGDSLLFQSDVATAPGSSGGGLFDGQGRLLGLTTRAFASGPRLGFSVPVALVQALVQRPGGGPARPQDAGLVGGGPNLLERLATDPRNWPAWEVAARQWVLDLPEDEHAWLALGLALDASARAPGGAPEALSEGVEAYRHSLALRREPVVWNNLGVSLDLLNRFEEAERAFREALAMAPDYALAWLNLGSARMNAGRHAAAVEALQRGLALRPDEAGSWVRLAHCQERAGQREAAVATLRIALRYRPQAAELWLDLWLLLVGLDRWDEVEQVQERLAPLDPGLVARLRRATQLRSTRSPAGAAAGRRGR